MKASKLIIKLQELIEKNGDLDVSAQYETCALTDITDVIFLDDGYEPYFMTTEYDDMRQP